MASITKKIAERLAGGIKRLQPVVADAKKRDVGEADTVIIVTEMLANMLGYDRFKEVTSEVPVKGTYCDLAIKLDDNKVALLIEVKAIGLELKDAFVKQAVDYAANEGIDWVVLTNAAQWRIYAVTYGRPIGHDLVGELNFLELNPKDEADLKSLYLYTKEALTKSGLEEYHLWQQAMSRFFLGAMILSEPVLKVVRKELCKVSPDVRIEVEEIRTALIEEVLKRDVLEGDRADEARKKIAKKQKVKPTKQTDELESTQPPPPPVAVTPQPPTAQAGA